MQTSKRIARGVALCLAAMLLLTVPNTVPVAAETAQVTYTGCTYSYLPSGVGPEENLHGMFSTPGFEKTYCAEHGVPDPMGGQKGSKVTMRLSPYTGKNAAKIRKVLYYGYGGPAQWSGFASSTYNDVYQLFSGNDADSRTEACGHSVTAMALTEAYDGDGRVYPISGLSAFQDYIAGQPAAPDRFEVYILEADESWVQELLAWRYAPMGSVTLKKSLADSGDKDLVAQNPDHYKLAGAQYGVYTSRSAAANQTRSARVGVLTTRADGTTNTLELEPDTYYVREIKAPPGYALESKIHTVTVTSEHTSTVLSGETPLFDDLSLLIQKTDGGGNGAAPSLAGAEFTVRYFTEVTKDVSGLSPAKTWVFRTDEQGQVRYQDAYRVRGDALFKDGDGTPQGIIGTYEIYETKAPEGYLCNDTHYVRTLEEAGDGLSLKTFQYPTVSEVRKEFRVTVTKQDADLGTNTPQGDAVLGGAVFGMYQNGVLLDQYTTDSHGGFTTKYYTCGTGFVLRELQPPRGYLAVGGDIPVEGTEPGQCTVQYTTRTATVAETPIKGRVGITKVKDGQDVTGAYDPEPGAEFQVYLQSAGSYDAADARERDVITTDADGYGQTKLLPYGVYVVHQSKGPESHGKVHDFTVTVDRDGAVYRYILNNAVFRADLRVEKIDAETGKAIPAAGTAFQIRDQDTGELVTFSMQYPHAYTLDTFRTDETGSFQLPGPLPFGQYQLIEQQAPEGYVLSEEPVTFVVDGATEAVSVCAPDLPQKAIVRVTKTGEMLLRWERQEDGTYTPVYGEGRLQGAVFAVTAAEDIVTGDGTRRYRAGETVCTLTTGEDGTAESIPLYLGTYFLQEQKAPDGYVLDETRHRITLSYAGQETEVFTHQEAAVNIRQRAEIHLQKVMETDPRYGYDRMPWSSVVFGLYAAEAQQAQDGSTVPADGLIERVHLTADGAAQLTTDLPTGSYYLRELETGTGYALSEATYPFTFAYAGQDTAVVDLTPEGTAQGTVENTLLRGTVRGHKITEDGKDLAGAVIGLFPADTRHFTALNALQVETTDRQGRFTFARVPFGKYVVRELRQPDGYVLCREAVPVEIGEADAEIAVELVDQPTRVEIRKVDHADGKPLTGAVLQLLDGDGQVVCQWKSGKRPYVVTKLPVGAYTLREVKAPAGYTLGAAQTVTVRDTAETQTFVMENSAAPATGDPADPLLWLCLVFVAVSGVTGLMAYRGRH